ncbi:MAG: hypothetical protein WA890_07430 [Micromonospora sp.]
MDAEEVGTPGSWLEFGGELRLWRRRAGLTQTQLGLRVGYPKCGPVLRRLGRG